jgi:hypothetical protein
MFVDVGLAMFLMNPFHVFLHNSFSPAFKTVIVSHKLNSSPEWLQRLVPTLATTWPHLLNPT